MPTLGDVRAFRETRMLAGCLLAVALLLTACGGSAPGKGQSPEETLREAVDNLRAAPGLTAVVTLRSTPGSLQALAAGQGKRLSAEDAAKILGSSLTVSGTQTGNAASRLVVEVAGRDALEVRSLASKVYLRADVPYLLRLTGRAPGASEAILRQAQGAGMGAIRPLLDGRWVRFEGPAQTMPASPPERQQQAVDRLLGVLRSSTTVSSEGAEGAGEHLVARVDLREVLEKVGSAAGAWGPTQPLPRPEDVPARPLSLNLWVEGGRLTQVELDLLQLEGTGKAIPPGVEQLAIRVGLSEFSGELSAPANAVPLDVGGLLGGLLGGAPPVAP